MLILKTSFYDAAVRSLLEEDTCSVPNLFCWLSMQPWLKIEDLFGSKFPLILYLKRERDFFLNSSSFPSSLPTPLPPNPKTSTFP